MKNWKTTLAGGVAAVGAYLKTVPEPVWLSTIGEFMMIAGTALLGYFASDKTLKPSA